MRPRGVFVKHVIEVSRNSVGIQVRGDGEFRWTALAIGTGVIRLPAAVRRLDDDAPPEDVKGDSLSAHSSLAFRS
jgi:hypothetical protein